MTVIPIVVGALGTLSWKNDEGNWKSEEESKLYRLQHC